MGTTSSYGMHFNDMKRTKKIIRKERRKTERARKKLQAQTKKQLLNNIRKVRDIIILILYPLFLEIYIYCLNFELLVLPHLLLNCLLLIV